MINQHDKMSWDQCCSCCPILEKNNKALKELIALNKEELIIYKEVINTLKESQLKLPKDFDDKLKQRIKEIDTDGNSRHNNQNNNDQ